MKRTMCMLLAVLMFLALTACGQKEQETATEEGFVPSLDTTADCYINVGGGYDNFEALEAEFDRFNEYYPNVELKYTKIDDYNNMIGTVLNGNEAPDIYVNYSWMYGREQYRSSIDHAEDLSDPALGFDLDCIRGNIILNTEDGSLPMVPVFSNTYGMLVNNDLFEKEGLSVPTTYQELVEVCKAFHEKGYENPIMGFSKEETTSIFTLATYPFFCGTVAHDADAVKKLNALDPSAGEYMRPSLEKIVQFLNDCFVNLDNCAQIENNYDAVILRFFEGDVPMMTCSGDTVSGTKKRESRSESFIANPFNYSFAPVPMSDEGANFLDMPNLQFSVNKNSPNLDMANEFMRFLITPEELSEMAQKKGLMSPTKDLSFNSMYAAFGSVPESRILSPEEFGLTDDAVKQLRMAVYGVGTGAISIDEAIAAFGTFGK
ncbi:MAG: carbohydrate ABC transporter substrate-binding protein [Erysipelotrichaceae bacterium]|nr:carbohydrate ABC transporter substrate-binding protein [Erysipelotrichaceae bacterium]MBQ5804923.1 carbohydrate ABC transporter substrate-binding protein [Erysipelotrichaceae bacterium]